MPVTLRSSLLLLVLAVLLPGVAGGVWYVASTYKAERQAHEQTLQDTSRALSMVVESELAKRAAVARVLSMSHWLDTAPELQPKQMELFAQLAGRALEGLEGWIELRTADGTIFDSRRPADAELEPPPEGPGDAAVNAPVNAAVNATVNAAQGSGGDVAAATRVLPLRLGAQPDSAHAAVLQPVRRDEITKLNLLVTIRPAELQRIIDAQNLPPGWLGVVLDSHGKVVARHPGGLSFLGRDATADLRAEMALHREGRLDSVSLEGKPVTGYFTTTQSGWTYVSAMPRDPAGAWLPPAAMKVTVGALLLLLVAMVAAHGIARRIENSVHALKGAAARLQRGEPVPIDTTGVAEYDEVAGALAEAATAVAASRAELESQVAQAVAHTRLAEQKASQSQRVKALGQLTGGVAHDFNNLLGVISNSAHLMGRHPAAAELAMPLAATLRAVETGSQLTQHLLRFAGRRPVQPQVLQLGLWLPALQDLLRSVLGRRIELVVHVAEGLATVRVDPNELELALVNLALNARDAMPQGGELRVTARHADAEECAGLPNAADTETGAQPPERRYVLIAVTDNGAGISPATLPRVFEPFFTTKEVGTGTGLGLSQVHGFCQQAAGAARIESTVGLGTTVTLLLPVATGLGVAQDDAPHPAAAKGVAGAKVLLVEDNETLQEITAALLRACGAHVACAANAADALQQVADHDPFDVVLSDVVMPGQMNGIDLARLLRQLRPGLPVVLISGFNTASTGDEFVMLRKPCSQDDLLSALATAIHGDGTGRDPDG